MGSNEDDQLLDSMKCPLQGKDKWNGRKEKVKKLGKGKWTGRKEKFKKESTVMRHQKKDT